MTLTLTLTLILTKRSRRKRRERRKGYANVDLNTTVSQKALKTQKYLWLRVKGYFNVNANLDLNGERE